MTRPDDAPHAKPDPAPAEGAGKDWDHRMELLARCLDAGECGRDRKVSPSRR